MPPGTSDVNTSTLGCMLIVLIGLFPGRASRTAQQEWWYHATCLLTPMKWRKKYQTKLKLSKICKRATPLLQSSIMTTQSSDDKHCTRQQTADATTRRVFYAALSWFHPSGQSTRGPNRRLADILTSSVTPLLSTSPLPPLLLWSTLYLHSPHQPLLGISAHTYPLQSSIFRCEG